MIPQSPKRLTNRPVLLAFLVFLAGVLGYAAYYRAITDDYFGGDVVTLFHQNPTSYALPLSDVTDLGSLARRILRAQGEAPENSAGAFVHSRLSEEAQRMVERLAANPDSAADRAAFLLEFNRALVDADPGWPSPLLAKFGAEEASREAVDPSLRNRKILGLLFHPDIALWVAPMEVGALLKHIVIGNRAFFTLDAPSRYAPLAVSYATFMILYLGGGPERFPVAVAQMALLFGAMILGVYLLSRRLLGEGGQALLATLLFATSLSVITSSMMVFSLPYLFVTICTCFSLYGYLRYRDAGKSAWMLLYLFFGIVGPWTREFAGIIPFVVIACEVMDFRGRRSALTLAASLLLAGHGLYPSFLPWVLGWNQGHVFSLLSMGKAQMHASQDPNWHQAGFVFVHMPPLLWLIALSGVFGFLASWRWPALGDALPFWQRVLLRFTPRSPWLLLVGKAALILLLVGLACAFAWSLAVVNAKLEHFAFIKRGGWLFLFLAAMALFSLKHHPLPPIFFLALLIGYLRWNVAEVHLSFLLAPLAVMLVAWMRDVRGMLRVLAPGRLRSAALVLFYGMAALGVGDQLLNVYSSATVQRRLIACNKEMGAWLRENTPKHSAVIANFFYYTDLFYYSGFHIDPYESVENNPFGPAKTIHTDAQMEALLASSTGRRGVYFMEAEHPFFEWQAGYHSHKWVRTPPGELEQVAHFSLNVPYFYLDPLKHFLPRFWISFPGYMDWFTDYWWDKKGMFRRAVWSDYSVYKLKSAAPVEEKAKE